MNYGIIPPYLEDELVVFKGINTHFTGNSCENIAKSYFLSQSYNIAEPVVDNGVDILVEIDGIWKKVQVKKVVIGYKNNKRYHAFFFNATNAKGKRKSKGYSVDYFFHIIKTPHREICFFTPNSDVPVMTDGHQVMAKDIVLDRFNRVHSKKKELDVLDYLVSAKYSQELITQHIDFFKEVSNQNESQLALSY